MNRAAVYVDGFNVYHSMPSSKYKWLDLAALAKLISPRSDSLSVYYFSALCKWDEEKNARHRKLIAVYEDLGIHVVYGKFKKVFVECNKKKIPKDVCDHKYERYAEKQTDVNLACRMLKDAYEDKIDRAYIISRDTDMIPAIKILNELNIKTMIVFPPFSQEVEELKNTTCFRLLKERDYNACILPDVFTLKNGTKIHRPDTWK